MDLTYRTEPAPGARNEDYVIGGPDWCVVLDGVTRPPGVDTGCRHDVPWLVRRLGAALATGLATSSAPLTDILAEAITATCAAHAGTCDLANPDSPSSTVAIARRRDDRLECLVLADSPIVVRHGDGSISLIADDRTARLPGGRPYPIELVRAHRNRPHGFWVASTAPQAAYEAVTGSFPLQDVAGAGIFSDGVTRLVEWYGHTWARLMDRLEREGPGRLIRSVREAERARRPPYGKRHDDATAVLIRRLRR